MQAVQICYEPLQSKHIAEEGKENKQENIAVTDRTNITGVMEQ